VKESIELFDFFSSFVPLMANIKEKIEEKEGGRVN
jgi:hypothetical protein